MANEIQINYTSGRTVYFVRFNSSGQVALTDGSSFEDWGTIGGHDADDYDVSLSEVGSGGCRYIGHFDASGNISEGIYAIVGFRQAGANPANGDRRIAESEKPFYWNGSQEIILSVEIWRRFFRKITATSDALKTYNDDDSVRTTQAVAFDGTTKTVGNAS